MGVLNIESRRRNEHNDYSLLLVGLFCGLGGLPSNFLGGGCLKGTNLSLFWKIARSKYDFSNR